MKKLIDRINKLESEIERMKKSPVVEAGGVDSKVLAMIDVAHIGLSYQPTGQTRFLVLHVLLANTSKETYTIARDQVTADLDGEDRKVKELPQQLQHSSIQTGKQLTRIFDMKPPKEWRLPANGLTGCGWCIPISRLDQMSPDAD